MAMSIIREALARLRRGDLPDLGPGDDLSHCGCALSAGCWGSGGWHHARHTLQTLYAREKALFAEQRQGWSKEALRRAWADWLVGEEEAGRLDEDGVHLRWRPYLGAPYCYERCAPYMAAYQRNTEAAQAGRVAERRTTYERR